MGHPSSNSFSSSSASTEVRSRGLRERLKKPSTKKETPKKKTDGKTKTKTKNFRSLTVVILNAENLLNVETFGKLDPYCIVRLGKTELQTAVLDNAGIHPYFNTSFMLPYLGEKSIKFTVMDKNKLRKDREVGHYELDLSQLNASQKYLSAKISLKSRKEKKEAGILNVRIRAADEAITLPSITQYHMPEDSGSESDSDSSSDD